MLGPLIETHSMEVMRQGSWLTGKSIDLFSSFEVFEANQAHFIYDSCILLYINPLFHKDSFVDFDVIKWHLSIRQIAAYEGLEFVTFAFTQVMEKTASELGKDEAKQDIFGDENNELSKEVDFVDFPSLITLGDNRLVGVIFGQTQGRQDINISHKDLQAKK